MFGYCLLNSLMYWLAAGTEGVQPHQVMLAEVAEPPVPPPLLPPPQAASSRAARLVRPAAAASRRLLLLGTPVTRRPRGGGPDLCAGPEVGAGLVVADTSLPFGVIRSGAGGN